MANLNRPCPDCGRIGVCICDDKVVELRTLRATIAKQTTTIARLEKKNTRLKIMLSNKLHTIQKLQNLLRYLRPALPVLQSMLSIARMNSNKATEMLGEIDAALKDQTPPPRAPTAYAPRSR